MHFLQTSWNLSCIFYTLRTSFCIWPMQYKVFFYEIFCCVTLHCVLCYITFHYKFNGHRFIYRSKRHAQSTCIFLKKRMVFSNDDKTITQNDSEEKSWSSYKIWKDNPSKKWDYSSIKRPLKKFRETGSIDRRHGSGQPRTVPTKQNKDLIKELVCSQDEQPLHLALRKTTERTWVSRSSIRKMVRKKTLLTVQALENTTNEWKHSKQKRNPRRPP